jgi:hypothetical protein
MPPHDRRVRPVLDGLEGRVALSAVKPIATLVSTIGVGAVPADRNRPFTPADLQAYAKAYDSFLGQAAYNLAYDFHGTGYIGQNDSAPILGALAAITPRVPFRIVMNLAPGEQIQGNHTTNSGGVTYRPSVTVIGHTTPNSIVFFDKTKAAVPGNYKFRGGAIAVNSQGVFSVPYKLDLGLTNTDYLIITPFGQRMIHDFPIIRQPTR